MLSVRRRVFRVLFDRSNEAISPTVKGLDAALHLPIVAHGPAHGHQTRVQAPIANELMRPELLKQLVFRDHAMAMAQEVDQDLKDLGPHLDLFAAAPEFIALCVEEIVTEDVAHSRSPLGV